MKIMIDTEIWSFSIKKPAKSRFRSVEDYASAVKFHEEAKQLIKKALSEDVIYMSMHQISEIFHVLAFRGTKLPLKLAKDYVRNLIDAKEIIKVDVSWEDLLESIQLSSTTGIHIWDFLCFVPLKKHIQAIYTADKHFTHKIFQRYNIEIINPLNHWMAL